MMIVRKGEKRKRKDIPGCVLKYFRLYLLHLPLIDLFRMLQLFLIYAGVGSWSSMPYGPGACLVLSFDPGPSAGVK